MKRLFTALLAAVFAFAFTAPIHNAAAAGKDEVTQPESAMDNAMSGDKGSSDTGKKTHHKHHHHKHHEKAAGAKTSETTKTNGSDTKKHLDKTTGSPATGQ